MWRKKELDESVSAWDRSAVHHSFGDQFLRNLWLSDTTRVSTKNVLEIWGMQYNAIQIESKAGKWTTNINPPRTSQKSAKCRSPGFAPKTPRHSRLAWHDQECHRSCHHLTDVTWSFDRIFDSLILLSTGPTRPTGPFNSHNGHQPSPGRACSDSSKILELSHDWTAKSSHARPQSEVEMTGFFRKTTTEWEERERWIRFT